MSDARIAAIRSFNRFYTRQIGLLEEGLLKSEYSLTEARVLFELAQREDLTATELGRDLRLDAGYLSRLLKKFEELGLIRRTTSKTDARQSVLTLTATGREAFAPLNRASQDEIARMLQPLSGPEKDEVVRSMRTIQRLLDGKSEPEPALILRPHRPGDIGWIAYRQGILYHEEYGWDQTFEALVAEIAAAFVKNFDPQWECSWIAERGGEIAGSVFLVRRSDEVAKLRLLYVEPSTRGLGIGAKLVGECIGFARMKGYKTLTLWTNDVLVAARRIYEKVGFNLVHEEPHHSFGKDLVGQTWELTL